MLGDSCLSRLEDSYYSEPYRPCIALPLCHACTMNPPYEFTRLRVEGKEGDNYILYIRLFCPNNPEHNINRDWERHARRPRRFRWKKRFQKLYRKIIVN